MATKKRYIYRYLLIALVFCMVCVIYVGRLFYIQITGRDGNVDEGITESRVKIQAVRGEILDRNGKTFEVSGSDLLARALCHEIDHLDGKLFIDCVVRYID